MIFKFVLYFALIGLVVIYTQEIQWLHTLFSGVRYFCFILVLPLFFFKIRKLNLICWLLVLYFIIILYSSLLYKQNLIPLISNSITIFTLLALLIVDFKSNVNKALQNLSLVFSTLVFLNFFLILLYPEGMWPRVSDATGEIVENYIIGGNRNQMGATLIVANIVTNLCYFLTGRYSILSIIVFIMSLISIIIGGSITSLLGVLGIFVIRYIRSVRIQINLANFFLASFIAFQFVAVFSMIDFTSNHTISHFVEDVLGRDLTFSGRTDIWERTWIMIILSPIFGYGYYDQDYLLLNINAVSPHNFLFSVLLKGGLLLFICLLCIVFVSIRQAYKYRTRQSIMLVFGLWILLSMSVMEVYPFILYVLLFFLIGCSKYYQKSTLCDFS